ncbi:MAG: serine/threonine-protein kinase [Myxococcaceae bacterium]|nr:serine/threonine-protein kinase [Myxococcaceae bacterium]
MTPSSGGDPSKPGFDDALIGRTVSGKWRIEKKLGVGGMGTVYLATDLSVDRPVALKFLLPALAAETEYRARFEQEARVMAKVDHPNLVTLYGVERDGEVPFLVMKYVTGRTLARLIKDRGFVPLSEALPLIKQLTSALTALHAQGYIHRDFKPGNVIVSDEGHVTVLDFGLIRSRVDNGLTRPGIALGSPFYMSPEQAIGETVDARSDLYTLAVVLTELLTGKRPFVETDAHAVLLAHLEKLPASATELNPLVPGSVSVVLLTALSKKPADRQASVAELWQQLSDAAATSGTVVGPPPSSGASGARRVVKGDSGRQKPVPDVESGPRRGRFDDDEQTVSARRRAKAQELAATDTSAPIVDEPAARKPAKTFVEVPVQTTPEAPAETMVGLPSVSQATLSGVSEVTPSGTSDSARTLAALPPVAPTTKAALPSQTMQGLDEVTDSNPEGLRPRTLREAFTTDAPAWVYVAIGGASVLVVALLLWLVLS